MIRFHAISRLDGDVLDGIHLLWSPPFPAGHSLDGFTIYRRDARGERKDTYCFDVDVRMLADLRSRGVLWSPDATLWADAKDPSDPLHTTWTYRLELVRRHSAVTVTAPGARAAFAGTADGAVVTGEVLSGTSVTLRASDIGIVWVVTDNPKEGLRVCGDVPPEGAWTDQAPIVKNLQVPFAAVNPAVTSSADGLVLASSRAHPELLDGDFEEVSRYANAALSRPAAAPAWSVVSERPDDGSDWDVSPYGLAVATTLLAPWRRGWGFSHLDNDGLTPGRSYDYRIIGTVRRRDRDERMYDLHTVPRGYRLPLCFRWGSTLVWPDEPPVVTTLVATGGDPSAIRKGFKTNRVVLALDTPSERIVLDAAPGATIEAEAFRYGAAVASVSATTSERTLLDFGSDVDLVVVEGSFALAGIVPLPVDPALDPDEPVPIEEEIYDVAFVATNPPPAPGAISVMSLSDPARTAARGVHDTNRGFAITWEAPPAIDPAALPYLPGSASAPPTEVASYMLERTWQGRPFTAAEGDGLHLSGRNAQTATDTPRSGFDLLRAFPPGDAAASSHADDVNAVEVFEADELAYGDQVTYRVISIDATGRPSAPRTSAPTPLRKHVRPPPPSTPPQSTVAAAGDVPASGVEVRLIQSDDPDLTPAQRALAGVTDVVILRWGWGPDQRALDPDVTEFRIYHHGSALTALDVTPDGPPSAAGTGWSLPVHFSRPVAANEFAGVRVVLGAAYQVLAHPAGVDLALDLGANPIDPARAPSPQSFVLTRTTTAELDPEYWDERIRVVPRVPVAAGSDAVEEYQESVPASWVAVAADTPRQRAAYGVTAADAEAYVPDRRAAIEPAPRPGNESTVAATEVTARYFGRPTLIVADLADVIAVTLPRQSADDVHGRLRPADYLPPGFVAAPRMLLERLPAPAVLPRIRVEPGAISLVTADGTASPWVLSPADEQALRAGQAAGLIPDRFFAHAAALLDGLDADAAPLGIVDPAAELEDTLPNRASRWLYRLRAVDAMGRPSAAGQVLAVVVHVPSGARAVMPTLLSLAVAGGAATVRVDCRRADGDVFVFVSSDTSLGTATASLSTIRNRDDLAPLDRLVVRDAGGRRLAPIAAVPDTAGFAQVSAPFPPDGLVVHAWALAVTPEGVPSRLVGPLHADALTGGV